MLLRKQEDKASDNFLDLILSLLGVIQGLALNHIAEKCPNLLDKPTEQLFTYWLNLFVCLIIIVRIFQTYYSAALDKIPGSIDIADFMSIFTVGLLQYWIINAMTNLYTEKFSILLRISCLALMACILHGKTTIQIILGVTKPDNGKTKRDLLRSEVWNLPISALIGLVSLGAYLTRDRSSTLLQQVAIVTIITLLIIMIWKSLDDAKGSRRAGVANEGER